jgi:hypothetical protein
MLIKKSYCGGRRGAGQDITENGKRPTFAQQAIRDSGVIAYLKLFNNINIL